MTLADLFNAVNLAGVRMASVNGRLELRGPAIPPDVAAGAAEHKAELLALLPASTGPEPAEPDETAAERAAIACEGCLSPADAAVVGAAAAHEWDAFEAQQLVALAIAVKSRAGWALDDSLRQQQGQSADKIDAAELAGDLPGLRVAVREFAALFPKKDT